MPIEAFILRPVTRAWQILLAAGLVEIVWAVGLKQSGGLTKPLPTAVTIVAYVASFYLLALAMKALPLGTAYAVWTGVGAAGAAIIGVLFFKEPRDLLRLGSLALIVVGVIGLRIGSRAQ